MTTENEWKDLPTLQDVAKGAEMSNQPTKLDRRKEIRQLEQLVESQAEQIKELSLGDNKMIADLSKYVEVLEDQIAKQAEQTAVLLAYLGNLLALIHRDGGQHQTEVGTEQAVKDAEDVWLSLRESHDAQAAQIARLREMVK